MRGGSSAAILTLLGPVEATAAADKGRHFAVEDVLASLLVDGGEGGLDDGGVALVNNFDELAAGFEGAARRERELADLEVLLAVEEHHGREVGDYVAKVKRHFGGEDGDDAKSREHLEVLSSFTVDDRVSIS